MDKHTFIEGLSLTNYRGIGPLRQEVTGLAAMNLFIGSNNSGKSAFLAFVAEQLSGFSAKRLNPHVEKKQLKSSDVHLGQALASVDFEIAVSKERLSNHLASLAEKSRNSRLGTPKNINLFVDFLATDGKIWFSFGAQSKELVEIRGLSEKIDTASNETKSATDAIWKIFRPGISGGTFEESWLPETVKQLSISELLKLPKAVYIPAIRQISAKGEQYDDASGKGLIDQLAEIQNPGHLERHKRNDFDDINNFVRIVTDDESATLEIPHDREHILVHMNGRLLPLDSLGTGIHEIIMLAAFCTLAKDQIVCIEEPEIHLHPALQRKLMKYLKAKTTNQYFIATHSAVLIDTPGAATFHISLHEGQTVAASASTPSERYAVCADLGYRASDIVQANSIIWVEGPSDRIYLKHWINAVDSNLIEGLHYSIMFYGGRLLNHLSVDDDEIDDFIKLRRLNQHLAVVMDSDKQTAQSRVNETKKRIVAEFGKGPGIAWVTKGREVENYVPPQLIELALSSIYTGTFDKICAAGAYEHVLHFHKRLHPRKKDTGGIMDKADKIKVAKFVCALDADLSVLDLKEQIDKLVGMIRGANA